MLRLIKKEVIAIIGWLVGLITPLFLYYVYECSLIEIGKSLFNYLHLTSLFSLIFIDINNKLVIQKFLILLAFIVYPIMSIANFTNAFNENTFVISIFTGWIYMLGLTSLFYSEKN